MTEKVITNVKVIIILVLFFNNSCNQNNNNASEINTSGEKEVKVVDFDTIQEFKRNDCWEEFMDFWKRFRKIVVNKDTSEYFKVINYPLMLDLLELSSVYIDTVIKVDGFDFIIKEGRILIYDKKLIIDVFHNFLNEGVEPIGTVLTEIQLNSPKLRFDRINWYTYILRCENDFKPISKIFNTNEDIPENLNIYDIRENSAIFGGAMFFERVNCKWKLVRILILDKEKVSNDTKYQESINSVIKILLDCCNKNPF